MVLINTIIQNMLQILRDPAWQGIGVIIASILSLIAIFISAKSLASSSPDDKKNSLSSTTWNFPFVKLIHSKKMPSGGIFDVTVFPSPIGIT